ncbi:hypothetical protein [Micromonospora maris]|uniref:hypothetical protein n=1 Tax=Micromonospora maris TaxID=1003110 RepID=UPI0011D2B1BA|nr:hypothetical protein [Micromonospora maris]
MRDRLNSPQIPNQMQGGQIGHFEVAYDAATRRPGLHIPWSGLSLGLFAISMTSIGTLIVVVSIKDVDLLSTIALALAVLAFAAQLIVSLAQAQGSAQQLTQTERVNTETKSALSEVKSTANALLTNQSDQFNKILSALLRSATEDAVREVAEASSDAGKTAPGQAEILDPEAVAERVEERVKRLLSSQSNIGAPDRGVPYRLLLRPDIGSDSLSMARTLSPEAILVFASIVAQHGATKGMLSISRPASVEAPSLQELSDRGLIRLAAAREDRQRIYFTGSGRVLAMLIMGDHFRNPWYWTVLLQGKPEAPE